MRSEVTSRSNWAKDSKTLSVSLPIELSPWRNTRRFKTGGGCLARQAGGRYRPRVPTTDMVVGLVKAENAGRPVQRSARFLITRHGAGLIQATSRRY